MNALIITGLLRSCCCHSELGNNSSAEWSDYVLKLCSSDYIPSCGAASIVSCSANFWSCRPSAAPSVGWKCDGDGSSPSPAAAAAEEQRRNLQRQLHPHSRGDFIYLHEQVKLWMAKVRSPCAHAQQNMCGCSKVGLGGLRNSHVLIVYRCAVTLEFSGTQMVGKTMGQQRITPVRRRRQQSRRAASQGSRRLQLT